MTDTTERDFAKIILVVDDNADSAEMLEMLLTMWGHKTMTALDGPSALVAAEASRPDVVLLDLRLPGLDGYEVARRLRASAVTKGSFIVAISGYGSAEDRAKTLAAGFDAHLVKPLRTAELEGLLRSVRRA